MHAEALTQNQICDTLYGKFPRYVGPIQRQVNSMTEIQNSMTAQSGVMNCFVSVYSFPNNYNVLIDKLFLESDYKDAETALQIGQILYEECTEKYKLPTLPIWSGNRSPHIMPLFVPEIVKNPSDVIKQTAYQISYSSNQYYIDPNSYKHVPYIDTRVLEPRRLCRYPNTRRITPSGTPSHNHCIVLDTERFPDMSISEVLDLSLSPQTNTIKIATPTKKISEIYNNINLDEWQGIQTSSPTPTDKYDSNNTTIKHSALEYMIHSLIQRPCNRHALNSPNPTHRSRISIASELHQHGITEEYSNYFFSLLGLYDYDPSVTSQQIHQIYARGYFPFGKRVMQEENLCSPNFEHLSSPCHKCFKNSS